MVIDEVQDDRQHMGVEVLTAAYRLLASVTESSEDGVLQFGCGVARQASVEPEDPA